MISSYDERLSKVEAPEEHSSLCSCLFFFPFSFCLYTLVHTRKVRTYLRYQNGTGILVSYCWSWLWICLNPEKIFLKNGWQAGGLRRAPSLQVPCIHAIGYVSRFFFVFFFAFQARKAHIPPSKCDLCREIFMQKRRGRQPQIHSGYICQSSKEAGYVDKSWLVVCRRKLVSAP